VKNKLLSAAKFKCVPKKFIYKIENKPLTVFDYAKLGNDLNKSEYSNDTIASNNLFAGIKILYKSSDFDTGSKSVRSNLSKVFGSNLIYLPRDLNKCLVDVTVVVDWDTVGGKYYGYRDKTIKIISDVGKNNSEFFDIYMIGIQGSGISTFSQTKPDAKDVTVDLTEDILKSYSYVTDISSILPDKDVQRVNTVNSRGCGAYGERTILTYNNSQYVSNIQYIYKSDIESKESNNLWIKSKEDIGTNMIVSHTVPTLSFLDSSALISLLDIYDARLVNAIKKASEEYNIVGFRIFKDHSIIPLFSKHTQLDSLNESSWTDPLSIEKLVSDEIDLDSDIKLYHLIKPKRLTKTELTMVELDDEATLDTIHKRTLFVKIKPYILLNSLLREREISDNIPSEGNILVRALYHTDPSLDRMYRHSEKFSKPGVSYDIYRNVKSLMYSPFLIEAMLNLFGDVYTTRSVRDKVTNDKNSCKFTLSEINSVETWCKYSVYDICCLLMAFITKKVHRVVKPDLSKSENPKYISVLPDNTDISEVDPISFKYQSKFSNELSKSINRIVCGINNGYFGDSSNFRNECIASFSDGFGHDGIEHCTDPVSLDTKDVSTYYPLIRSVDRALIVSDFITVDGLNYKVSYSIGTKSNYLSGTDCIARCSVSDFVSNDETHVNHNPIKSRINKKKFKAFSSELHRTFVKHPSSSSVFDSDLEAYRVEHPLAFSCMTLLKGMDVKHGVYFTQTGTANVCNVLYNMDKASVCLKGRRVNEFDVISEHIDSNTDSRLRIDAIKGIRVEGPYTKSWKKIKNTESLNTKTEYLVGSRGSFRVPYGSLVPTNHRKFAKCFCAEDSTSPVILIRLDDNNNPISDVDSDMFELFKNKGKIYNTSFGKYLVIDRAHVVEFSTYNDNDLLLLMMFKLLSSKATKDLKLVKEHAEKSELPFLAMVMIYISNSWDLMGLGYRKPSDLLYFTGNRLNRLLAIRDSVKDYVYDTHKYLIDKGIITEEQIQAEVDMQLGSVLLSTVFNWLVGGKDLPEDVFNLLLSITETVCKIRVFSFSLGGEYYTYFRHGNNLYHHTDTGCLTNVIRITERLREFRMISEHDSLMFALTCLNRLYKQNLDTRTKALFNYMKDLKTYNVNIRSLYVEIDQGLSSLSRIDGLVSDIMLLIAGVSEYTTSPVDVSESLNNLKTMNVFDLNRYHDELVTVLRELRRAHASKEEQERIKQLREQWDNRKDKFTE
jgi:hypothetical protein